MEGLTYEDPMRIRAMGAGEFQWGNNSAIYSTYWKNHVDWAISQKGVGRAAAYRRPHGRASIPSEGGLGNQALAAIRIALLARKGGK